MPNPLRTVSPALDPRSREYRTQFSIRPSLALVASERGSADTSPDPVHKMTATHSPVLTLNWFVDEFGSLNSFWSQTGERH